MMLSATQATHSLAVLSVISSVLAIVAVGLAVAVLTMRTSFHSWAESSSTPSRTLVELVSLVISRGVEHHHHTSHFPANVDRPTSRHDEWG